MSSGTGSYFNSATVTDEVLSFGSADAISAVSLTSNPEFSGTGFSGSLTSGTGNKAVTAEFKGSGKTVSVSGTPLGELTKTTIDYVKSASSADTAVTVSAGGQLTATLLTGVKYSGSGAAAGITSGKGNIAAAGSTTVAYAEPLSVSIGYKPSGTISIDSITPTGTVAGTVKPTGSITGTQTVAGHTHDVSGSGTASGSVTVS